MVNFILLVKLEYLELISLIIKKYPDGATQPTKYQMYNWQNFNWRKIHVPTVSLLCIRIIKHQFPVHFFLLLFNNATKPQKIIIFLLFCYFNFIKNLLLKSKIEYSNVIYSLFLYTAYTLALIVMHQHLHQADSAKVYHKVH